MTTEKNKARAAKLATGDRPLYVLLSKEGAEHLERIKASTKETNKAVIERLLAGA